jgi:hypothetical protein
MSLETIVGFVITLLVFSYLLGDNLLYRLAVYVFVGTTAGYTAVVIVENVIVPVLLGDTAGLVIGGMALVLTGLLALKAIPFLRPLGNLALAFLIAVGASVAVVGAVTGTLLPLSLSTVRPSGSLLNSAVLVLGVICSLVYFQYAARRRPDGQVQRGTLIRSLGVIGEGFITVTLGAVYGAAILSSLSVLTGHLSRILGS